MDKETKSTTEREKWLLEFGGHYKTTISDGDRKVEGRSYDSKDSQRIASDKWEEEADEDEEDEED